MSVLATENRVTTVVQHVQNVIQQGNLPAGAALPSEVPLSRDLGISRGMVREGYRMLAAMGAVELGNGRAPRVGGLCAGPVTTMLRHGLETGQVSPLHVLQFWRAIEGLAALERTQAPKETGLYADARHRAAVSLVGRYYSVAWGLEVAVLPFMCGTCAPRPDRP